MSEEEKEHFLTTAKKSKKKELSERLAEIENGGFFVDGIKFYSTQKSISLYQNFMIHSMFSPDFTSEGWTASDGVKVTMTKDLIMKIMVGLADFTQKIYKWKDEQTKRIDACLTGREIANLQFMEISE